MVNKYGANGEQFSQFLEAARRLQAANIEPVVAATRGHEVRAARSLIFDVSLSAATNSAIESAIRQLIMDLRSGLPAASTTAERVLLRSFTSLLASAALALATRPQLDDDTIGLVLDPIAQCLDFEWRTGGVGQ